MASIKLHVFRRDQGDHGTESCDYRGKGELGAGEDDQHRTILEKDPASEAEIELALERGPDVNKGFATLDDLLPDATGNIASLLGLEGSGPIGLRLGVWDQ